MKNEELCAFTANGISRQVRTTFRRIPSILSVTYLIITHEMKIGG